MWSEMVVCWKNYMGSGITPIFFLAAWLYLFREEKEKRLRVLFVYVPMIVLLLFFNPLFFRLFEWIKQKEVYFRVLWLIPFSIVMAYTAVRIYGTILGRKRRGIFLGGILLCIVAGGRCVYSNPLFQRAENLYHVPNSVVHICDAIEIKGREVTAVFPQEMLLYVRQYSPVVCMPYGRETIMEGWTDWAIYNPLFVEMESKEPDAEQLGMLARDQDCVYIVISAQKKIKGDLGDQGYAFFDEIDGYRIYKDIYFVPGF